jgi:hypothetical protein
MNGLYLFADVLNGTAMIAMVGAVSAEAVQLVHNLRFG